ncbi:target of Sbf [Recurvomyces mirabilis]|nr:target of Sbf [Recurvomyces mirabilis]
MKYILSATALLAATVAADKRDLCADGSTDDNNNWYCQAVKAITYTGVGGTGSYNRITSMDPTNGQCQSAPQSYSGNLSPLDEEVSMHFRGPIQINQFAVYTPSSSSKPKRHSTAQRHPHAHLHARRHQAREANASVGDMVTATINGIVQTWVNEWSGQSTPAPPVPAAASSAPTADIVPNIQAPSSSASSSSSAPSSSPSSESGSGSIASSSGGWSRQAYYNASTQTSEGLVFLNHNGGSGSGTFDYHFGNSLSYATADGKGGSSTNQTLAATTLPSSAEVVIMSNQECGESDCGYSRPQTVAYHGFGGPSKAFFFEFQMPYTGESASNIYDPVDMPAVWMLNAQIPRTLQYGQATCSCWTSGCGEFDIFEVLAPGDQRMKSTLHGNVAGGDSDYFDRPGDKPMKAAMVLYNNNIHIKLLSDDADFGEVMDADVINDICGSTLQQTKSVSLFKLGS